MATVQVLQLSKAMEILGESVVAGSINEAGHLILTRGNGEVVDAGDFSAAISSLINGAIAAATLLDILISSSAVDKVTLRAKRKASQTADIFQVLAENGTTVLGKIDKDGKLAITLKGSSINAAENTLTNVDAVKIAGSKVTIDNTAPSSPAANDIWIKPNGT